MQTTKWHRTLSFSLFPAQYEAAEKLLRLAEENPAECGILAASSALALAACLEQAVRFAFESEMAQAVHQENKQTQAEIEGLFGDCAWRRVRTLPEFLSGGSLKLVHGPLMKKLRELIELRNKLVHVEGGFSVSDDVELERHPVDGPLAAFNTNMDQLAEDNASLTLPANPWMSCSVESVKEYLVAVRQYLEEVVDGQAQAPGKLLVPTSH